MTRQYTTYIVPGEHGPSQRPEIHAPIEDEMYSFVIPLWQNKCFPDPDTGNAFDPLQEFTVSTLRKT